MDVTKTYEFIGIGTLDATKPYGCIKFGDIHGPKPYKFMRLGLLKGTPCSFFAASLDVPSKIRDTEVRISSRCSLEMLLRREG